MCALSISKIQQLSLSLDRAELLANHYLFFRMTFLVILKLDLWMQNIGPIDASNGLGGDKNSSAG